MDYLKIAQQYFSYGLSVIPIGDDKIPMGKWTDNQTKAIEPGNNFTNCKNIGLVCGVQNILAIDLDCKYDITGKLFENYKKEINECDPTLLKKLTVQSTKNKGYHFIFKCSEIEGNLKLANRYCTEQEKIDKPKEKIKVLIETRGNKGYIIVAPSEGYKLLYGSFDKIQEITPKQKNILYDCAKLFNEVKNELKDEFKQKKAINTDWQGITVFDDYNNRADILELLQNEGWKVVLQRNTKTLLLRPGGEGKWSADWDSNLRIFYCFTSSSEFQIETGYNPSQVYTYLKHNGDYSSAASELYKHGYGERQIKKDNKQEEIIIIKDHIIPFDTDEKNILAFRNGTFEKGYSTGIQELDNYFVFKKGDFVCVNGHANIGKTILILYLMVLSAALHKWSWVIYSSENRTWSLRKKIMEFLVGYSLDIMSQRQYDKAKEWMNKFFTFINTDRLYSAKTLINIATEIYNDKPVNGFLVDPYNSLKIDIKSNDKFSTHEYHYEVASRFRIFANSKDVTTFLNCHAVTESLRRKDHDGYPLAPFAEDTEGGGKFVNRADDFVTLHRIVQHPDRWMETQFHVRKIKEVETGGRPTPFDSPVILKMKFGSCGFTDINGFDPLKVANEQMKVL